jgi:hypothetical protein
MMTTRLFAIPFAERMEIVSRWESSQEIAYQIAWAHMRGEVKNDSFYALLRSAQRSNVKRMVRLILDHEYDPLDEAYVAMARDLAVCGPLMTEGQGVLMIRALYRREFICNPDPEKAVWWDFVETVHETLDPEGRTSRSGLGFQTRDFTREGAASASLLNRLFAKADRIWNYGSPEEGGEERPPWEVLERAAERREALEDEQDRREAMYD